MSGDTKRIARAVAVTVIAATLGGLLGGLLWQGEPLSGLVFLPFTLVGATALLLPTYIWARRAKAWSRTNSYLAVLVTGALGSFLILTVFVLLLGGLTAGAVPLEIFLVGSLFGCATAFMWVAAHYLTGARSNP